MEANVAPDQAVVPSRAGRGIRILLVWGVRFTGECLAELLERDPSMSVVGLCADLSEAVALSASMQPDIVLLDGRMPEGAAAARRALDEAPGMRIVVSSVRETEDDIVAWAEAGVIGYIPRPTPSCDFIRLMMEIHSGEQVSSGRVVAGLLRRIAHTANGSTRRNRLVAQFERADPHGGHDADELIALAPDAADRARSARREQSLVIGEVRVGDVDAGFIAGVDRQQRVERTELGRDVGNEVREA